MAEHVAGKALKTTRRRSADQRRAYALRRLSLAVDRVLVAKTEMDKALASKWAKAWHARL